MLLLDHAGDNIIGMDISIVINQMIVLFILLVVGVVCARTGLVDTETNRRITRFAVAVPQSAMILSSVMTMEEHMTAGRVAGLLAAGFGMYGLLFLLALAIPRIARINRRDRGLYSFMIMFANTAFMGIPVVRAMYGGIGVFYVALFCVPFNVLAYTVGIQFICGQGQGGFQWREAVSPTMIAALTAAVLVFLPIQYPAPLTEAMGYLGNMITPLSMIIIGASLGKQKFRDVFGDWRAYAFAPVRLILTPVVVWAVMGLFVHDETVLGVITVIEAMPVASLTTMLSIRYDANEETASRTVFVTTALSVLTIPFVCWLLL